jgi:two-component system chemotaxis sensor kinase CheA
LFRTVHSLKGAARSVEVSLVESICHGLETIFAGIRENALALESELFETLFSAADAIAEISRRLSAGENFESDRYDILLKRLAAAAEEETPSSFRDEAVAPAESPEASATAEPEGRQPSHHPPPSRESPEASPIAATEAINIITPFVNDNFIRIPAAKLDELLTLSGELLIARRQNETRMGDIERLLAMAKSWQIEWMTVDKAVGKDLLGGKSQSGQNFSSERGSLDASTRRSFSMLARNKENLRWLMRQLDALAKGLAADHRNLEQVAAPLEAEVLRTRMVPFAEVCNGFDRVVRDLAQAAGKKADLIIRGGEIEVDRSILQKLRDPLLHLIRNAVDHGIESPEVRQTLNKPERGRISVLVALSIGRVKITVSDDGRGLDKEAIRQRIRQRNLEEPESDDDLYDFIFESGFSTSKTITTVSGRGIGLDAVKTAAETLRGVVTCIAEPGRGTRFILNVPLTLTMHRALLVSAGGRIYAFDIADVNTLLRIKVEDIRSMEGREMLSFQGAPLPVAVLADALGTSSHETLYDDRKIPAVVLEAGTDRVAFIVDELLAEQEIVVKGLGRRLKRIRNISGATILGTGKIALIINSPELIRSTLGHPPRQGVTNALIESVTDMKKRLLLVDDSVTTRALEKSILEAAGYDIISAADGLEAWQLLQEKGADLVVSDVEMPRMDGISLTETIRSSRRFNSIPVILVTAMETEQDRTRGMDAGADAYLPKSTFDQKDLLAAISQLL